MAEEKNSIFRKKAIDRISSPEEMDDYLQVTGPSTWIVLIAIIFLILGFIVWGIFGKLDTTMNVAVVSDKDSVECLIPYEELEGIVASGATDSNTVKDGLAGTNEEKMYLEINDKEYEFIYEGKAPDMVTKDTDDSICMAGNLDVGAVVQPMTVKANLKQGVYVGKIVVETVSPIHFILN